MKLVIEPTPDRAGHMFRADTHDKHIRPRQFQRVWQWSPSSWRTSQKTRRIDRGGLDVSGLPPSKRFLREDLARTRCTISKPLDHTESGNTFAELESILWQS